jgi:hypothetical protein
MSELRRIIMQTPLPLKEAQKQLADLTGLDLRTIEQRYKDGKVTALIRRKLLAVRHLQVTLVCETADRILQSYREHKDQHLYPDDRYLLRFIEDTLVIVQDRLRLMERLRSNKEKNNDYEKAEFTFVLGHLNYSLAFHGKWPELNKVRPTYAKDTLKIYETARELVEKTDPSFLNGEQAARRSSFIELLELNAMETKWQMAKRGYIPCIECLKDLEQRKILNRLRNALRSPYNAGVWQIAHNGLIFASLFNRLEDMEFFYKELVKLQPGFRSWNFTPGETPTLGKDQDLQAFRQAFPHLDTSRSN